MWSEAYLNLPEAEFVCISFFVIVCKSILLNFKGASFYLWSTLPKQKVIETLFYYQFSPMFNLHNKANNTNAFYRKKKRIFKNVFVLLQMESSYK